MLHQPSKFLQNPLTHLLNLHSTSTTTSPTNNNNNNNNSSLINNNNSNSITEQQNVDTETDSTIDVVNGNIGKSFTIAAILGLRKNVIASSATANITDNNNRNFSDVMNLSLNQSHLKNGFDSESVRLLGTNNSISNSNNNNNNSNNNIHRMQSVLGGQHFNTHHHLTNTSALQSLQQLHQHHTSANSGFHGRERSRDHISSKKSSLKSKRVRTIFTPEQLERLEAEFERQQYMVGPERLYLAHTLQLTEAQVKVWFQNRRIKWRKHHLELTQQRLALLRQRQIPSGQTIDNRIQLNETELTICTDSMDEGSVPEVDD